MSAAVQASEMLEPLFTIMTLQSIVLAQALDLRGVKLTGSESREIYSLIRGVVPFVHKDQPLGVGLAKLRENFKELSARKGQLGVK
jgi:histidine ammonia-lyase